jgi:phospholipase/lecithinase/hemolysin
MFCRTALFLLSLTLVGPLAAQIPFNEFVVFGDSLSDNGNLYAGASAFGLPPTPGPPLYATGE